MIICNKCGAQLSDDTKFCGVCGAPVTTGSAVPQQPPQQTYQQPPQQQYQQPYQPPQPEGPYDEVRDAADNKMMGILAYVFPLIPILSVPNSKFARYHANQGILLWIILVALNIVSGILNSIFHSIYLASLTMRYSAYSALRGIVWLVVWAIIVLFGVIGIMNASKGEKKPLPVIGNITILK